MSTTVERVKEQLKEWYFDDGLGDADCPQIVVLKQNVEGVLSSLAAERCVWAWDNDGFYHTSCGKAWQFSDDRKGIGDFHTCPFKGCGKRIEVKEE